MAYEIQQEVKRAAFSVTAAKQDAAKVLIAEVEGKRISLLSLAISGDQDGGMKLATLSGGEETTVVGALSMAANTSVVLPHNKYGWCQSAVGAALDIVHTGNGTETIYTGCLTYILM